jgi:hypothetical protein
LILTSFVIFIQIKKLLTLFFETYPDLLAQMDVSYVKNLLGKGMIQIVKRKEEDEGPGIFVFRLSKKNLTNL